MNEMCKKSLSVSAIAICIAGFFAAGNASAICPELKAMMTRPSYAENSIETLIIETIQDSDIYPNLDIDQDKKIDDVRGSCSSSLEPADGCLLTYRLTSNGQEFSHQFPSDMRFFLVQYQHRFFAISTRNQQKDKNSKRQIHQLTNAGLKAICK